MTVSFIVQNDYSYFMGTTLKLRIQVRLEDLEFVDKCTPFGESI